MPPAEWYDSMHIRLKDWLDSKPHSDGFCSAAWAEVNYHSTMVLLHRPSPANPSPGVEDLRQALASAGQVMRAYKAMHRAEQINFGMAFTSINDADLQIGSPCTTFSWQVLPT